ncbi:MAG: hypothetical protein GY934_08725 [Gammaproteobacteria bacterium]|nr:hypothetical protein [Gammaproteobacteria bacterium]
MSTEKNSDQEEAKTVERADRRAFLRRSAYAAYMTPAMLSLVVENASAGASQSPACQNNPTGNRCQRLIAFCQRHPNNSRCQ